MNNLIKQATKAYVTRRQFLRKSTYSPPLLLSLGSLIKSEVAGGSHMPPMGRSFQDWLRRTRFFADATQVYRYEDDGQERPVIREPSSYANYISLHNSVFSEEYDEASRDFYYYNEQYENLPPLSYNEYLALRSFEQEKVSYAGWQYGVIRRTGGASYQVQIDFQNSYYKAAYDVSTRTRGHVTPPSLSMLEMYDILTLEERTGVGRGVALAAIEKIDDENNSCETIEDVLSGRC